MYEVDLKPQLFDPENDTILISLNRSISTAVVLNEHNYKLLVDPASPLGRHEVVVSLHDSNITANLNSDLYTFSIDIVRKVEFFYNKEVEEEMSQRPYPKLESVDRFGVANVLFNKSMIAPANLTRVNDTVLELIVRS